MGDKPGRKDEIDFAVTEYLIGDTDSAILGITGFNRLHIDPFPS